MPRDVTDDSLLDAPALEARLVRELLEESRRTTTKVSNVGDLPAGRRILEESPEVRCQVVVLVARLLAAGNTRRSRQTYVERRVGGFFSSEWNPKGVAMAGPWTYRQGLTMKTLISRLMRSRLPFEKAQLECLIEQLSKAEAWYWKVPAAPILTAVERHSREYGLSEALCRTLEALRIAGTEHAGISIPKDIRDRLDRIVRARME